MNVAADYIAKNFWTREQALDLCTLIHNLPSQKFGCHVALTGGLLYKDGPRKDCDLVIYQRGDTKGVRPELDWQGLWAALAEIGLYMNKDCGYVKKCTYQGLPVDILDPTQDAGDYGRQGGS